MPVPAQEVEFTDRELDVMNVLWDTGSATVQEVRDRLSDELALLAELGFGLDLEQCAATGSRDGLAYVSPKSGGAVSAVSIAMEPSPSRAWTARRRGASCGRRRGARSSRRRTS